MWDSVDSIYITQVGGNTHEIYSLVRQADELVNSRHIETTTDLPVQDAITLSDLYASLQGQVGASKKYSILANLLSVIFHLTYLVRQVRF